MNTINIAKATNNGLDSQPVRGFTELNKNQTAAVSKALASSVYNSMIAMQIGKDFEVTVTATGGTIVRK